MAGTHTTSRPAGIANETTSDEGASSKVGELASKGKDVAGAAAGTISEKRGELTQTAKTKAVEKADERRGMAVDKVKTVHSDLRDLTSSVRDKQPQVADALEAVLDRAEDMINYAEQTSVDEMARSLSTQARQRPAVVIGGMFAAGFLLARALKPVDGVIDTVTQGQETTGMTGYTGTQQPATLGTPRGTISGQLPQSTGTPVHV